MKNDPNEWTNLADRPEHADTVAKLSAWIPTESEPPLAGSRLRLIEIKNGHPYWEGRAIEDADQAQPPDS